MAYAYNKTDLAHGFMLSGNSFAILHLSRLRQLKKIYREERNAFSVSFNITLFCVQVSVLVVQEASRKVQRTRERNSPGLVLRISAHGTLHTAACLTERDGPSRRGIRFLFCLLAMISSTKKNDVYTPRERAGYFYKLLIDICPVTRRLLLLLLHRFQRQGDALRS